MKNYFYLVLLIPACVGAVYNCEYTPKCLEISADNFVFTEQEIRTKCEEFRTFQNCLDEWGKQCLSPVQLQETRAQMEKPLKALIKMCTDPEYRKEYLAEKESFLKIKDDWMKCQKEFEDDVKEASKEKDQTEIVKGFCCGLREFKDCADDLCDDKCTPGATKILNQMINLTKESVTVSCPANVMAECPENEDEKDSSSMVAFNGVYLALSMIVCFMFR